MVAGAAAPASASGPASPGRLVFVQALPKQTVDIAVDGRTVDRGSSTGAVVGPISVAPGQHQVTFSGGDNLRLVSTVDVSAGSSSDVVVHLPAQVDGSPVVNSYRTPLAPIAPGKARVLIAHTATVAPADVRVDGTVVFHDIANGEFATADLASGAHTVSLLPAGLDTHPILGPLQLSLEAGTVTMVYAVGNPRTRSMDVILHHTTLSSNGAATPASIDTGSAGLVAGLRVRTFSTARGSIRPAPAAPPGDHHERTAVLALLVALGAGLLASRRTARRRPLRSG
jgi:hypothetical protein